MSTPLVDAATRVETPKAAALHVAPAMATLEGGVTRERGSADRQQFPTRGRLLYTVIEPSPTITDAPPTWTAVTSAPINGL